MIKEILNGIKRNLMREYQDFERMQTDYSYDLDCYRYCQQRMDSIDNEMEEIRFKLEGGS